MEPLDHNLYNQFSMEVILDELLKSHLYILTSKINNYLSDVSIELISKNKKGIQYTDQEISTLKSLIMICNILYNRTDIEILPVEDGVYDLLLEIYKQFDPNFQVGSYVVQFRDKTQKENLEIQAIKQPIFFYEKIDRDEIRQDIFDRLSSFDSHPLNRDDFLKNPITFESDYIQKRTHNVKHKHPELVGTLDKCKFVTIQDAKDAGVYNDPSVKILERDFFLRHI